MIFINNTIQPENRFSENIFEKGLSIYEVIRIFEGSPIFLKDNILRLDNSLKKSNIKIDVSQLDIPGKLQHFIELNHITEGNVKYVLHFNSSKPDEYIFQIPHAYPTEKDYQEGVPTITHEAVRENPEVKYINTDLRTLANRLMILKKRYCTPRHFNTYSPEPAEKGYLIFAGNMPSASKKSASTFTP